ncbi:hypothetical protein [Sphingobacterium siyangense]|uniref:hypothetical protein n=2 Tax=Sphingobacterium TaxID=28453 RepID=UPI002897A69C|nr:hypothetical protein [Sphingobacterium siyangense]
MKILNYYLFMKIFVLLIILCFGPTLEVCAQTFKYKEGVASSIVAFSTTCLDNTNKKLFENHSDIESVVVWFEEGKPSVIRINDRSSKGTFYDMAFKGDVLDLQNKYGKLNFTFPRLSVSKLYGMEKQNFPTHWVFTSKIFPDSVVQSYRLNSGEKSLIFTGWAARYNGNYEDIEKQIGDEVQNSKNTVVLDSIIVLQGISEKGTSPMTLNDLKLIVGKKSSFSEAALRVFGNKENKWSSGIYDSGVNGRSNIKFFIQLHKNGKVTIVPSKYLNALSLD